MLMPTRLPTALLFALLFGALGCATTAKYKAKLQTWIGHDANELVQSWGPPNGA